jgi:hypothetical protein
VLPNPTNCVGGIEPEYLRVIDFFSSLLGKRPDKAVGDHLPIRNLPRLSQFFTTLLGT